MCERFDSAEGATFAEKVEEACTSCERCDGRPPIQGVPALSSGEVEQIANRVETLVWRERSGEKLNKLQTEPEIVRLILFWRQLEAKYERRQQHRLCAAIENMIAVFGGAKQR